MCFLEGFLLAVMARKAQGGPGVSEKINFI